MSNSSGNPDPDSKGQLDHSTTKPTPAAPELQGNRSAFFVKENENLKGDLYFWTREEWRGPVPAEQAQLREEFDAACAVLRGRLMTRAEQRFGEAFRQLLDIARAAFGGEFAQVEHGRAALNAFKVQLVNREGPEFKNEYLKHLALAALCATLIIMAACCLLRYGMHLGEQQGWIETTKVDDTEANAALASVRWDSRFSIVHFGLLLSATMWGIWLSFFVRNPEWRFEQLQHPESDLARPWSRLLAYGLLALILALFFQLQMLVVTVGGVSTSQISDNAIVALFIGLALGFLDKTLPNEVRRRLEEFFQQARTGTTNS